MRWLRAAIVPRRIAGSRPSRRASYLDPTPNGRGSRTSWSSRPAPPVSGAGGGVEARSPKMPCSPRRAARFHQVSSVVLRPSPAFDACRASRPCRYAWLPRDRADIARMGGCERRHGKRAVVAETAEIFMRCHELHHKSFQTMSSCSRPSRSPKAIRTKSAIKFPTPCSTPPDRRSQEPRRVRDVCPTGFVVVAGEITTKTGSFRKVARAVIGDIGYTDSAMALTTRRAGILTAIDAQSADISQGVTEGGKGSSRTRARAIRA